MVLELSNLMFTDQDDIVPASGVEQILNTGVANTLAGNDQITGIGNGNGIANGGSINTGNGNDKIIGISYSTEEYYFGFATSGNFNSGDGNDIITGLGPIGIFHYGQYNRYTGTFNEFETGEGNDIITGIGRNIGLASYGGVILTRGGNDIIIGSGGSIGINTQAGYGGSGGIYTEDGDDIIIGSGQIGISMSGGSIDTGHGNDSIIANGGFDGNCSVVLGYGNDYLKGFGRGNYFGTGNYYQPPLDEDTLELTSGSYTVSYTVLEYQGTAVSFTKDGIIMNTFQFEKLIAGSTTYDFSSLTEGQTIVVA